MLRLIIVCSLRSFIRWTFKINTEKEKQQMNGKTMMANKTTKAPSHTIRNDLHVTYFTTDWETVQKRTKSKPRPWSKALNKRVRDALNNYTQLLLQFSSKEESSVKKLIGGMSLNSIRWRGGERWKERQWIESKSDCKFEWTEWVRERIVEEFGEQLSFTLPLLFWIVKWNN